VVATTNAGNTWFNQQLPSGLADVDDIWCGATGSCRAVGLASNGGVVILDNGRPCPRPDHTGGPGTRGSWRQVAATRLDGPEATK
jgi:hypothetical protein